MFAAVGFGTGSSFYEFISMDRKRMFSYNKKEKAEMHFHTKSSGVGEMVVSPGEYHQFLFLVKRIAVLEVLLLVLQLDRERISAAPIKMKEVWLKLLSQTMEQLEEALLDTSQQLKQLGGRILDVKQTEHSRNITSLFRGYRYQDKLLNEWIKKECVQILESCWNLCAEETTKSAR